VTQTKRRLNNYVNSTEQIKDYQEKLSQEGVVGHNGVGDALRQNDFQKFKQVVENEQGYFNLTPINQSDFGKIASDITDQVGYTDAYATTVKGKNDQLQKIVKSKLNKEEFKQAVANRWSSDSELRKYAQNRGVNDLATFYEVVEGQVPGEKVERGLKNAPSDDDSGGGGGGGYFGNNQGIFTFMSSEYKKINRQARDSDEEIDNIDKFRRLGASVGLRGIKPEERDAAMGAVEAYDVEAAADGKFLSIGSDQIYTKKKNSEDFEPIAGPGEEENVPIRAKDFKVALGYYDDNNEITIAQTREEIRNNAVQPVAVTEVEPYQGELSQKYLQRGKKQYKDRNNDESGSFAVVPLAESGNALALDKEVGQLSLDPDDARPSNTQPQQTEPQPDQQTESQRGDGDKPFSDEGQGDALFN
jgi:hypothetical protein